ncbi:S46 family peptidase [Burkholderiaceae bacterium DAT-1]|nr:S46 family peptidase [Burkholderiaceae bacterium DAT-1]
MQRLLLPLALVATVAHADEGQWQPYQMKDLKAELKRVGIKVPAEQLADLSKHPMSAIVSLGGCSASFVSPDGLVVTNHHCAYGAIQRNSTASKNLLAEGFLAKTRADELPGGPNERVYITESVDNVTDRVNQGVTASLKGKARHDLIEKNIKGIIAECEADKAYRCSVPVFHRGLEYYRIKQMMVKDVRLVYAPPESIGNYGGEVDNFEWPRHTGDFAFIRAYVGKDGRPADPSPDNVPYQSKDFLAVSAEGLKVGDPVLLAGYPGRTSRYRLPSEIRFARDVAYPVRVAENHRDLDTIAAATKANPEWVVRYASVVKSINNGMKKTQGLMDGFRRKDIAAIKDKQDAELRAWVGKQANAAQTNALLAELDGLIQREQTLARREQYYDIARSSDLLKAATTLYRLARESELADAEREPGFQTRDVPFIKARLTRLEQSMVPEVDKARWLSALGSYVRTDAALHAPTLDAAVQPAGADLAARVDAMYAATALADTNARLGWIGKSRAEFEASADPFIQLAVKLYDSEREQEAARKEIDGEFDRLVPQYMSTVIAFNRARNKPVYPDANSTLRLTYGTVSGYVPRDGAVYKPFTTVEGIVEKHTGQTPFNAPDRLLKAIAAKDYGVFKDKQLGTVPVDFLSSADTTGGNSGSAIMNGKGDLIGLNFDSTYESITKDWYFDADITRAVHVDARYMLWVMKHVDHADNVLAEMKIKYPK